MKKLAACVLSVCVTLCLLTACAGSGNTPSGVGTSGGASGGPSGDGVSGGPSGESVSGEEAALDGTAAGKVTLTIGDTTFNPENAEPDIDPHNEYSGWACIRYGVGETLVRYTDTMELAPWLAESWENVDPLTWRLTLREGVTFHSGRAMDAEAVRQCLEHLMETHDRAPGDLRIARMETEGQTLTIHTAVPRPALLHCLGDPYGCIVDIDAGVTEGIVAGTGPYIAVDCRSGDHLTLVKNERYWNGTPKIDELTIRTISDGGTLSMALQTGEIDAAYGLAYESYPLFRNENFTFSQTPTSRAFFLWMNYDSPITSDPAVRKAIAQAIDKEGFVTTLLQGNGYPAEGAFPDSFPFGGGVTAERYDPEGAKAALEEAGWTDTDGDGIRERDGVPLVIRWLTYPSRQELPLLAESSHAALRAIGIDVQVNITAGHNQIRKDRTAWDVYASAMVTAPAGDPEYFFTSCCLDSSAVNNGHFHSDALEERAAQLASEFDPAKRSRLAREMQQILLDDNGYVFCSFLQMSQIARSNVHGYLAHPCDYYQVTAELEKDAG